MNTRDAFASSAMSAIIMNVGQGEAIDIHNLALKAFEIADIMMDIGGNSEAGQAYERIMRDRRSIENDISKAISMLDNGTEKVFVSEFLKKSLREQG